jgi:gamma-glutamyl hercynylcysteine S-oxide synthase
MPIDRPFYVAWHLRNRRRSRMIFDTVSPDAYETAPINLRNPFCFYEGHLSAFAVNTLMKRGLHRTGVNEEFEVLFERGIDPASERDVTRRARWPSRAEILDYGKRVDETILETIVHDDALDDDDDPILRNGSVLRALCEHEEMHQETLGYMLHRLPHEKKTRPPDAPQLAVGGAPPPGRQGAIQAGPATLGLDRAGQAFGWDNEFTRHVVDVPAFSIDVHDTTNADYLEFVEQGGTPPAFWFRKGGRWFWRAQFEDVPLPLAWPVYVAQDDASAYAAWRGMRLPTEAEFHRAAFGTPDGAERPFPWGTAAPEARFGNFGAARWDPAPVGSHPDGQSAFGVHDLFGNGWEWTSTPFQPFPGFEPMPAYPNYSIDFFDGSHFVLKGASPLTATSMVRPTFRNWFRGNYPYVYATFRCANG